MYSYLLISHSWLRWIVLIALLYAIGKAYSGVRTDRPFSKSDSRLLFATTRLTTIQFLLGIGLYFTSPLTQYFLNNFSEAVHEREPRFFGLEHVTIMVIAVAILEMGAAKVKRQHDDRLKFQTMLRWLVIGLLLILSSVPWSFSPFTARPLFRLPW